MESASDPTPSSPEPDGLDAGAVELESLRSELAERDRLLAERNDLLAELNRRVAELELTVSEKDMALLGKEKALELAFLKIEALTLEAARHRRLRFGNKSEAFSPEQRQLFQESWDTDSSAMEAEAECLVPSLRKARARAGRQRLPEHLPRIEHRHEPESCACGTCGQDLVKIGEDVSEQLDCEPTRFFVHRHIRPQYACRTCEKVTAEPIPASVIDGGMAAPGLLSWVLISKYVDHAPLYRLERIAARAQVSLARSTLAEWVGRCGVALQPLADRLAELLRERTILHADETPVPQLDPGRGKTKRAYLWAYRSNALDGGPPIVVFDFQPGRGGEHARAFLQDWKGQLMVDDYGGYKALFGTGIVELACLAHCRRKFFDFLVASKSPVAAEAVDRIDRLYEIERRGKGISPAARLELRQRESKPQLEALHGWLTQIRATVANGGNLANAIDYTLRRWTPLIRYVEDGTLPIDNNVLENDIRPIAVGKRNWLFAGSERAGKRAAAIQSLLGTARLNGIEPAAWLKDTLEKISAWPNRRIDELLPLEPASCPAH
jgi:transposase